MAMTSVQPRYAYYKCIADPINSPAAGYSDEYSGKSLALKLQQSNGINTSAAVDLGSAVLSVKPTLTTSGANNFVQVYTTVVGVYGASAAAAPVTNYANLNASFNAYRFVSMAAKVTYTGSDDTSKGEIIMLAQQNTTPPTAIGAWRDVQGAKSVAVRDMKGPITASVHAFDRCPFRPLTADFMDCFPSIWIGILGGNAADNGYRVDVTFNLELIALPTSVHHQLAGTVPHVPDENAMVQRRLEPSRVIAQNGEAVLTASAKVTAPKKPVVKKARKKAAPKKKRVYTKRVFTTR